MAKSTSSRPSPWLPVDAWSWFVGLWEGEGYTSAGVYRGHLQQKIGIEMCDEDTIVRVHALLGGTVCKRTKREGAKQTWIWQISRRTEVIDLLDRLKWAVSERRRGQITDVLLKIWENLPDETSDGPGNDGAESVG